MIKKIILSVLGVVVVGSITSEGALGQGYVTSTQLGSIGGAVTRKAESNGNGFNGSVAVNGQACKGQGYTGNTRLLPFIPWPSSGDMRLQPALGWASAAKVATITLKISNTTSSLADVTAPPKPVPTTPPNNSGAATCPAGGVPNISDQALAIKWAEVTCKPSDFFTRCYWNEKLEAVKYLDANMASIQARLARQAVPLGEFNTIVNYCRKAGFTEFSYNGCGTVRSWMIALANMPAPNNGGLDFYNAYKGSMGYDAGANPFQKGDPNQPMYSNRPAIIYESYVPPQANTSGPSTLAPPKLQSTYSWGDPADRPGSSSYQQWMDLKNRSYWDWRNSDVGREQSAYLKYQYDTGANRDWLLGQEKTGWIIKWEQNLISQGALKADQTVQYSFK